MPDTAPAPPSERHDAIDALRGFALAGVLMANLGALSLYTFLSEPQKDALPTAAFDLVAQDAMGVLVDGKAVTLFAILFGVGFALQLGRAGDKPGAVPRFLRRVGVLLAIGLAHRYLVWWGDVLVMYAIVGALLVLFRRASDTVLLVGAFLLAVVLPPLLIPVVRPLLPGPTQREVFASALHGLSNGGYLQMFRANAEVVAWSHRANWPLVGFVGGRYLLGYWAGRRGLLQDVAKHRSLVVRLFQWGIVVGSAGSLLQALQGPLRAGVPLLADGAGAMVLRMALRVTPLALGIGYGAGFLLLFERPRGRELLGVFAPIGRMALTNYLAQSLLGVALFYGVGLGIGPRFGVPGWWAAWAVIFGVQVVASRLWLRRFRFGPAEWAWRCLTYGALQPLRLGPFSEGERRLQHM